MDRFPSPSSDDPSQRLLGLGLLLALFGVTAQTVIDLVNAFALGGRHDQLNADLEGNAFAWASASATFAAAFVCLFHAVVLRERRRSFVALAAIFGVLSVDDIAQIHERIGWRLQQDLGLPESIGARSFVFVYLPLVVTAAYLIWRVLADQPEQIRLFVLVGLALLGVAFLLEPLGTAWEFESTPDRIESAVEEGLELGGWILIASGLTALLYSSIAPRSN